MCEKLTGHDNESLTRAVHILQDIINIRVNDLHFKRTNPLEIKI